jgi:glutamate-1-semialdehyde 2,1-aminomutase
MQSPGLDVFTWPDAKAIREKLSLLAKMPAWDMDAQAYRQYQRRFREGRQGSQELARQAESLIPGGVHHSLSVRDPFPVMIEAASGPYIWDVDGNRYTDFVQAAGAALLGARYEPVYSRVIEILGKSGAATAISHPYELKLAQLVSQLIPSIERVRMTASGTEAAMAAIRAARAFTGADNIIKVGGAYHGWSDHLTYGLTVPGMGSRGIFGIPDSTLDTTHEVPPNDLRSLERLFEENRRSGGTAAVIVEPIGPQSGTMPVDLDYHAGVLELCRSNGALLIFDEVVTGFRLGLAGVQGYLGIRPDLTVLGKCLTAGFPAAGAVGGRADVMATLGPLSPSPTRVSGTLSANPMSCAAGYYGLQEMSRTRAPQIAARGGEALCRGLADLISKYRLPFVTFNFGSIVHLHATGVYHVSIEDPDFRAQFATRWAIMNKLTMAYAVEGLIVPATGRMFVSATHTDEVILDTLSRFDVVFAVINAPA